MNQVAVQYLNENKEKYPEETLVSQLRQSGYSEEDISESIAIVYRNESSGPSVPPIVPIKYAGFWIRWVANFIDALVLLIPNGLLRLLVGEESWKALHLFLPLLLTWVYQVVLVHKYQMTIGKMAIGIRVVSDASERLSLQKIILRETIGKFLSGITFGIGFLMVGFTKKKQGLHDMIAGSTIVYKNPEKKMSALVIILIVISALLPVIALIGMLASIVLVSLSSARDKASDEAMKATFKAEIISAILYSDENGTYAGFIPNPETPLKECNGKPVVNVAPDGNALAIFAKSCQKKDRYICIDTRFDPLTEDTSLFKEVDESYVSSGKFSCPD